MELTNESRVNNTMEIAVVIPNWNGKDSLSDCLDSLLVQTLKPHIIVVDNASVDGSYELVEQKYQTVELIKNKTNLGFAGGVNTGIKRALEQNSRYVALLNNDAVADKDWLKNLVKFLEDNEQAGIATGKILTSDHKLIDSTGEGYSNWGLPFPRGRGESDNHQYDDRTWVFGASGGASLYRVSMLKEIGLFDEAFFAYYEDVDISFRAQLAGWKVAYVPGAVAYHQIGATSGKIKGLTTYQTLKNLPLLLYKNMPRRYMLKVSRRYLFAHIMFFANAIRKGLGWQALKGDARGSYLLCTSWSKRRRIQKNRKVSDEYIWNLITHDLPPNANKLRQVRAKWWKLTGKSR